MESIEEIIQYVNDQLAFYSAKLADPKTRNTSFFQHHLEKFKSILHYLEQVNAFQGNNSETPKQQRSSDYISITPDDIEGLPEDLVAELGLTESDHTEFEIVNIINKHGGTMSLDHLIIALYKQSKTIHRRKILTAKLYRMVNKGLIFNVPDKRGVYSTTSTDNEHEESSQSEHSEDTYRNGRKKLERI